MPKGRIEMKQIIVKERPILIATESVKGILDDRKAQTRRIIKSTQDKAMTIGQPGDYNEILIR